MMYQKKSLTALLLIAVATVTGTAEAALLDRGNGLLYDDVLNLTWLQDANYAKTSGYDTDGAMDWAGATTWAANLSYGGYSDWRLASNTPVNGSTFNYGFSFIGTTDQGYNITSPNSELSYMYYVNLGLDSEFDNSGTHIQPTYGIFGNGTSGGQNNVGLVNNLQSARYWSGTEASPNNRAWYFSTVGGSQGNIFKFPEFYAWAVRSGDVAAALPIPGTVWLLGSGLVGLLGLRRRGNNKSH